MTKTLRSVTSAPLEGGTSPLSNSTREMLASVMQTLTKTGTLEPGETQDNKDFSADSYNQNNKLIQQCCVTLDDFLRPEPCNLEKEVMIQVCVMRLCVYMAVVTSSFIPSPLHWSLGMRLGWLAVPMYADEVKQRSTEWNMAAIIVLHAHLACVACAASALAACCALN